MILEKVRNHCIAQPGAEECFPFDETSPVYKVMGKMFAIISLDPPFGISLKCDPEKALDTLMALDREKKLLSRDIAGIDLRLPDRVFVRLSDAAAAARAEALKAKTTKPKGGDA